MGLSPGVYRKALLNREFFEKSMNLPRMLTGHAVAFFTVFVWGVTFVSTKVLLADFQAVEILFFRFAMAFLALYAVNPAPLTGMTPKRRLILASSGLTGICLYYLLENVALTYTMASNVGVILTATPLFTAIVAKFVLRGEERLGASFFIGFVVVMAGICLISFNGAELQLDPLGDLLAVAAALVWSFYACFTRMMGRWGCSSLQITRVTFGWGLLFMLPFVALSDISWDLSRLLKPVNLFNMLFLGLGASALCFTTWNIAVRTLGTVKASLYIYLVPVITVAVSAVVLHEPVTLLAAFGTALTLAGLFLSQMSRR